MFNTCGHMTGCNKMKMGACWRQRRRRRTTQAPQQQAPHLLNRLLHEPHVQGGVLLVVLCVDKQMHGQNHSGEHRKELHEGAATGSQRMWQHLPIGPSTGSSGRGMGCPLSAPAQVTCQGSQQHTVLLRAKKRTRDARRHLLSLRQHSLAIARCGSLELLQAASAWMPEAGQAHLQVLGSGS